MQVAATGSNAAKKRWLQRHPEYRKNWIREKRANDAAFVQRGRESARAWQKRNPVRNAWNQYRATAARKGFGFALTGGQFAALVSQDCHYCGAVANPLNGIDRVDSERGYVEANVVTACRQCNLAKRDLPLADFLAWVKRIALQVGAWS